ncbi:HEAT repeat domain-containing protein [Fulvivirga sp. M361]|uniref:HEAT repeat domain-containing protein n=1 Tax=Fulvivirga sp. M361 TaxID=2594266 RepID=UPI00117A2CC6|nr:HEAT repeat domain-containing protein [Fulvivirga sp. M361]TRX56016.1 HEAT repeat domain-containing protein [Fulvivirga sp. M361]
MEKDKDRLIEKYHQGNLTYEEGKQLESCIEKGIIKLEDLSDLCHLNKKLDMMASVEPSESLTYSFHQLLNEQRKARKPLGFKLSGIWNAKPIFRWTYSLALMMAGITIGWLAKNSNATHTEVGKLYAEVQEMKEMMMLTLLEKESTSDRLRAVGLTSDISEVSDKITDALLKTLNNDENVNVRLAALEALFPYASNTKVRKGLITSITNQESPMVQMGLAEMMVALQEKRAIGSLRELLKKEETPQEAKDRINESIQILI